MFSCKVRTSSYLEWNPERMSEVSEVSEVSDVLIFKSEPKCCPRRGQGSIARSHCLLHRLDIAVDVVDRHLRLSFIPVVNIAKDSAPGRHFDDLSRTLAAVNGLRTHPRRSLGSEANVFWNYGGNSSVAVEICAVATCAVCGIELWAISG